MMNIAPAQSVRSLVLFMLSFLACLTRPAPSVAQDRARQVSPGHTVVDSLEQKGVKVFSIDLPRGQFVYGEVNQISVDVVVKVLDPAGRELGVFDSPARGPEPFEFTTDTAGAYSIVLAPFEQQSGTFWVRVVFVEPAAVTPEGKVDQMMARYTAPGSPGGVVAVTKGGKIIFSKGYGLANVEYGIPNTPTTPYHMASVSKQFTAFAIVLLAQQGKLTLEDDVRKHLPELPDFGKTITLRHLLNHTSGLRDQWSLWSMSGHRMDDVIRQHDLWTLLINQRELNFDPGEEFLYSNSGYMLLSEVVARASGVPFGQWMKRNVFDPLGMDDTQIYDNHERIVSGRAYSYSNGPEGLAKAVLSYANSGATSLFSTAEDLAKWLENWGTNRVGGSDALREMTVRGTVNKGDTLGYALGVSVDTWRGQRRIAHSGGDAGYRVYVAYFPELDAGVITLMNHSTFNPASTSMRAFEAFFANQLQAPPQRPAAPEPRKEEQSWKPTLQNLDAIAGRYYSPELETFYTLSRQDSQLVADHRRYGRIVMRPGARENEFSGNDFSLGQVKFVKDPTGTIKEMRVSNGRVRNLFFEKLGQ